MMSDRLIALLDFLSFHLYDRLMAEMIKADMDGEVEEYESLRQEIAHLASLNDAVAEEARAQGIIR